MIKVTINGVPVYVKHGDIIKTRARGQGITKLAGIEVKSEDGNYNFIPKR